MHFQTKSRIFRCIRPRSKQSFLCQLQPSADILDVGCGNDSPFFTKRLLPLCTYTGIDIADYNQTASYLADRYIITSPERFPDVVRQFKEHFDAVISSHNIEHCDEREKTFAAMLEAVKHGGRLFMSFPSANSVNFPRREGCLNYYDDPTHKDPPPKAEQFVAELCANGFDIEFATIQYQPIVDYIRGLIHEPVSRRRDKIVAGTWEYYGFESIIWACRRS